MSEPVLLCKGFPATFNICALVINTILIIVVFKRKRLNRPANKAFAFIGLSNILFSIAFFVRGFVVVRSPSFLRLPLGAATECLSTSLSLMQLSANMEMAYVRYYAVARPLQFRTANSSRITRRIFVWCILSWLVGIVTGSTSVSFQQPRITALTISVSRFLGLVILGHIYYLISKKYRLNSKRVQASRENNGVRQGSILPSVAATSRGNKKLMKICLAIPISYFILNTPTGVFTSLYDLLNPCQGTGGIVLVITSCILLSNSILDPVFYFYLTKGRRIV